MWHWCGNCGTPSLRRQLAAQEDARCQQRWHVRAAPAADGRQSVAWHLNATPSSAARALAAPGRSGRPCACRQPGSSSGAGAVWGGRLCLRAAVAMQLQWSCICSGHTAASGLQQLQQLLLVHWSDSDCCLRQWACSRPGPAQLMRAHMPAPGDGFVFAGLRIAVGPGMSHQLLLGLACHISCCSAGYVASAAVEPDMSHPLLLGLICRISCCSA